MDEKLSTKIYTEVRNDILCGVYSARDFISEGQIAKKYGVSKAPVKEALHILAEQGFIISYPRKGYMVNMYSTEEINKIQEIRRNLETLCLQRIIRYATDQEIASLRDTFAGEKKSLNPDETINVRFHMALAEISRNDFLPEILRGLVYKATLSQMGREPDIEHFERIVESLLERNEEKAIQFLHEDIVDITIE